jgi:phospholipid transport system transporter-binding protein
MSDAVVRFENRSEAQVVVTGPLTFATVTAADKEGARLVSARAGNALEMDLQGVTAADSAGLALLVGWLGLARRDGVSLRYSSLPERLLAIARISDVDELLSA